jgi:hypothetical protein
MNGMRDNRCRFVSVSFGTSRLYDYLCDDMDINEGDRVAVDAGSRYENAVVFRVFYKSLDQMPLSKEEYKTVIRKINV